MLASVQLRSPDGTLHHLLPGDLVGRLRSAALHLDDGRVSEAHAMVSLRDGQLRLLSLRGGLAVAGKAVREVALRPDLRVQLARGVHLEVVAVTLPAEVLGIEGDGVPRQTLPGVVSIRASGQLVAGWQDDAALWIWYDGDGWRQRHPDGAVGEVGVGDRVSVGGRTLQLVGIPLRAASGTATRLSGAVHAPLRLVAHYDTVHIHRSGEPVASLSGILARLVSELVVFDGPVAWATLAGELWPGDVPPTVLRSRLDANLTRLRRRLRAAGVRTDLVYADGAGSLGLRLHPGDAVEDRT